jgi:DNA polymerase I
MRSCWRVPAGKVQVGTDAAGIQLRILADYLARHFKTNQYIEAIVHGKKEDETDIHNVNKRALGVNHIDRDDAKRFAYAWLLGAGDAKIGSILGVTPREGKAAKDRFEQSIEGLYRLKHELLPYIADKGWFTGYDGRKVIVPNLHKTLAGILQNGEAVVIKHWVLETNKRVKEEQLDVHMLGVIHDERQDEAADMDTAKKFIQIQHEAMKWVEKDLGFICPLEVEAKTGANWADCH